MTILTNSTTNNLLTLINDDKLKEQITALSEAYNKVMNRPFSIGIMGKAGAGKSSFVNALCQKDVCRTGGVGGCTREIQKITAKLGEMDIHIYDFPGIAENTQWSKTYWDLYVPYLEKLDRIFWLIKVDDRAIFEDENFYKTHIESNYENREKFVVILSQADKAEPKREWNYDQFTPSSNQIKTLLENKYRIYSDFMCSSSSAAERIIAVSTDFIKDKETFNTYGFDKIFDMFAITLNNIGQVSDELSLNMHWEISKREINISLEFTDYLHKKLEAEMEKTLRELEKLLG